MAVTIDTSLSTNPNNSAVTLLNLGTSSGSGLVTSNTLRFGSSNTIAFANGSGVYHGSTSGVAATPYGEAGNYLASEPGASNGITFNFASAQKYFGLNWGSIDAGNVIRFYNGNTLVYTITGADVAAAPNGSQGADGSFYVNLNFIDISYTRAVLTTATPAFEFTDVAYAATTIPTTAGQTGNPASVTATDAGTNRIVGFDSAPASLAGTVFLDANADGTPASTDAGVANVTVRLLNSSGTVVSTDVTDATGQYRFNNVAAGNYSVVVTPPSGDSFSPTATGTTGSKVNSAGSAAISVVAGSSNTVNAGVYVPVTLSGSVFTDTNGDGVRGTGDAVVAGATVQLLNGAGTVVATTTTGSSGAYSFTGIAPGTYQVQFAAPAGTVFTAADQGGNDAVDSDANPATGRAAAVTLTSGQSAANISAGVYIPASISGVVFTDTNGDGVRGTGEPGTAGLSVQLLNSAGTAVASTTTGTGGAYSFTGVAPGTYQVQFAAPAGNAFTTQNQGSNAAVDSDANPATGRTAAVTLSSGSAVTNLSAGTYAPVSLSGVFFTDSDGDGIQGTGEAGVAGRTVQLLNSAGTVVASTTTGTGGAYSFAGLAPSTYQVQFVAPSGTVFTAADQGSNDAVDSDANPATGRTAAITLASGQSATNLSAGTYAPVSVGGVFFTDTNGDGIQGTGEAGVAGQAVQLLNAAGTAVASTTTGTGGAYSFTGVAPGTYQVQFAAPAGNVFTAQDQGNNDAIDSDVGANGRTAALTLSSGQAAANVSAGSFVPAAINGVAFTDSNGDGIQGTGENGRAGMAVQLLNAAGTAVASTTTGTGGAYSFTGVAPGTYQVQFTPLAGTSFTAQDQGSNDAVDSDVNASGRTAAITLASGQTASNVSAGSFTPVSVSGVA
ncbi:SdrD B-like domain-containing protein, partial [Roseomonas sp. BN140053]|uniref:SdrD B-like domain-containing protein n=1 Tax=Roseomonas sp. BN140053 TaxID=3391898 RepID=UPI0039E91D30